MTIVTDRWGCVHTGDSLDVHVDTGIAKLALYRVHTRDSLDVHASWHTLRSIVVPSTTSLSTKVAASLSARLQQTR